MEANKKEASSSESSSESSSDSSSSSSSSSGSESSSSSDSDSSSSQGSAKVSETKKSTPVQKNVKRNSDTAKQPQPNVKQPQSNVKQDNKPPTKQKPVPAKSLKATVKIEISSTEDEEPNKSNSGSKQSPKKKTNAKQKPSGNVNKTAPSKPSSAKVIPKTLQSSSKSSVKSNEVQKNSNPKTSSSTKVSDKEDPNKKKSIFSPENSSEDSEGTNKVKSTQKPPNKSTKKLPPKVIDQCVKKNQEPQHSKVKSNTVSSEDRSSSDSSSSDTDSSVPSAKRVKRNETKAKSSSKPNSNSDSENETNHGKKTLRKSTRSANARKSKHVLGKNVYSDTDSDTESTKRSSSHSPVKKAPASSKGKAKKKAENVENKSRGNDVLVEERTCPLEGCNSLGHISGKTAKHFTLEACPMYHNLTPNQCKEECVERKKREDNRKKILEVFKKSQKATILQEQKQNLQQIREARAKFESVPDTSKTSDTNREPILNGFVPDYDLKLFRDAQAIAAEKIEEDLKTQPHTKATKYIEMGKYEMEVWYQSPYPEDYTRLPKLYICEFCLRYMKSRTVLMRHIVKCVWRHPPGEEVYRKDKISVWEVDGKKYKQYCQNLCLLAKFFLDHKTLYYDVEPFLFYVMTIYDSEGCHTVGYFSKEKNSFLNYNVSCILTLPPYQRQGYGRLLIDFSYLLTRVEGKIGSPEKPLSDLGLISYRSYWKDVLLGYLCANSNPALSVKDISQEMAISSYDIVSTLQALGMMKYWKGKHIILKKQDVIDEYVERTKRRTTALKEVDRACLRWNPPQPASV